MKRLILNLSDGKFPTLGGTEALSDASPEELRILLCLLEMGGMADDGRIPALAAAAGCGVARARAALRYWREVEVLRTAGPAEEACAPFVPQTGEKETANTANMQKTRPVCRENGPDGKKDTADGAIAAGNSDGEAVGTAERPARAAKPTARPLRDDTLLESQGAEIATTVRDRALASFIDICQQTVGRVFSTRELGSLTAILDSFPFTEEYLLTLISYCKRKARRFSFLYLEKTAHTMLDREIMTLEQLDAYIAAEERFASREWRLRRLLGIGERRLGSKEAAYLTRWTGEFDYDEDIIGIAYDIAVNQTGKLSLPYMDKLLSRFAEAGCRTVDEVNELLDRERAEHAAKTASQHTGARSGPKKTAKAGGFKTTAGADDPTATRGSSFRERDYLSAALRRSYGDSGLDESHAPEEKK